MARDESLDCGGAGGRPRPEPKPASRCLPLPPSLQARGDRAACHPGAGQRARPGSDRPLAAGHPGFCGRRRHRLPGAARARTRWASRRPARDQARLPAAGGGAAAVRSVDRGRRPQRGAHSLPELGLRHPAQPRRDGRQRARPAAAAGGGSALERAAQRDLVGLRGQQRRLGEAATVAAMRARRRRHPPSRNSTPVRETTQGRCAGCATTRLVLRSSSQYRAAIPRIGRSQRNGEPP